MSKKLFIAAAVLAAGILAYGVVHDISSDRTGPSTPDTMSDRTTDRSTSSENVRTPAAAGSFYPDDREALERRVGELLAAVAVPSGNGRPQVFIAPHAGYDYSGPTAAAAFRALGEWGFSRIVLIGRSHQVRFEGVVADGHDVWRSPFGDISVDQAFIVDLIGRNAGVRIDSAPHDNEHSLEVMIPFIQQALGGGTSIVPLLFGGDSSDDARRLAEALAPLIDASTAVVISSDLSHYPALADAEIADKKTVDAIVSGDPEIFRRTMTEIETSGTSQLETAACGAIAIEAGMRIANSLGLTPRLLVAANSGEGASGDAARTVGYAAVVFFTSPARELDAIEQLQALDIARKTLEAAFAKTEYQPDPSSPVFREKRGVFVTLKERGDLRGCIGVFEPSVPLSEAISQMSLAAAFNDQRFSPLRADELDQVEIEVSILSPLRRAAAEAIVLGRDGVQIRINDRSGVFLPQVATETGWDKEKFLDELCSQKAGLDPDCWRDPSAAFYVFTAQVFHDKVNGL